MLAAQWRGAGGHVYFCGFSPKFMITGQEAMRTAFFTLFLICGAFCIYLFAIGATYPPWEWNSPAFLERFLAPFQYFSFVSGLLVVAGLLAFLLSLLCFESRDNAKQEGLARKTWGRAMEISFLLNTVLVAGLLALTTLLTLNPSEALGDVGTLFVAVLVELGLGTFLAILLVFYRRGTRLYLSTLTLHLLEVVAVSAVFVFGSGA